jgi:hypothetical protein
MTEPAKRRVGQKIWWLQRTDDKADYGSVIELIIAAPTEQAAREWACDTAKAEDQCVWLDRRRSHMTELGKATDSFRETTTLTVVRNSE